MRKEWGRAACWAALVMLATLLPYAYVWLLEPGGAEFPLLLFSSDDAAVYLSWLRQAAEGSGRFRNLFTPDSQPGAFPNLYFLLLGQLGRAGVPLPAAAHLGRLVSGWVLLVLVYRLIQILAPGETAGDRFARGCAFWGCVCSGGLGWLQWQRVIRPDLPADAWQPEAFMLPTLYVNGLWCAALALMTGTVICLLLAEQRMHEGRSWMAWAAGAGVLGLLLGNIHSYDVIHLAAAWLLFLGARSFTEGRVPWGAVAAAAVAAAVASPSVLYMAWLYRSDAVFRSRADVETLTPGIELYLTGFGLSLLLAFWYADRGLPRGDPGALRRGLSTGAAALAAAAALTPAGGWSLPLLLTARLLRAGGEAGPGLSLLLPAWLAGGFAAAYLPFAFQRKLLMGVQIPLGILAGFGIAALAGARIPEDSSAGWGRPSRRWLAAPVLLLLSISPLLFMLRDVQVAREENLTSTRLHPAYWRSDLLEAYRWLGRETPPDSVVLALPSHAVLIPALSGRAVYAGHWGETPDFGERFRQALLIYGAQPRTAELRRALSAGPDPGREAPDPAAEFSRLRRLWLHRSGITHLVWGPYERQAAEAGPLPLTAEPFLTPIHRSGETVIFRVH